MVFPEGDAPSLAEIVGTLLNNLEVDAIGEEGPHPADFGFG